MTPRTPLAEHIDSAPEQMPPGDVLLYTHNGTNAFNEGDDRIEQQLRRLDKIKPDAGFLSEAYLCDKAGRTHLEKVVRRFGDLGYKVVVFDYSEEGRLDRHGGIMFARKDMVEKCDGVVLNGRLSIQMTLRTHSGARFNMISMHANDRHKPRVTETNELIQYRTEDMDSDLPAVLVGDLNSDARKSFLKWIPRIAGEAASMIKPLARGVAEQESGQRTSMPLRVASLAIRACFQMSGDTIRRLMDGDPRFVSANTDHQLTSYVPKNIPSFARRALERWTWLNRPYIEADYFLADRGSFSRFARCDRLPDDEHLAILTRYSPPAEAA